MILVGIVCAVLGGISWAMGAQNRQRPGMIAAAFVGAILAHLMLPGGHPLRQNTGGSWELGAIIADFGALIWIFRLGLRRFRSRAVTPVRPDDDAMSGAEQERYARHIVKAQIPGAGTMRQRGDQVLVIGAGGGGAPALRYSPVAWVGTIGLVGDATLAGGFLQRSVIHPEADIGRAKVSSAARPIRELNPYRAVRSNNHRLTGESVEELIGQYDIVLDVTDKMETRYEVHAVCGARA